MPDVAIAPATTTSQPAGQPAPQSTAPAGTPTQVIDPAIASRASEAFGAPAGTGRPEPASVEEFDGAEGQPANEPVNTGDPNAGQTAQGVEGVQPQPTEPKFGEEYLKELEGLLPPDAAPVQPQQEPDLSKPEEMEKVLNPDGKTTDPAMRLQNAQSYIGKLHQKYGQENKALKSTIGQLIEGGKEIQKLFRKDDTGQMIVNPREAFKLAQLAPTHEMESVLAEAGVKLVPINARVDVGDDPAVQAWESEWANAVVPGTELTLEEKLAQIQDNPKLARRMTVDQAAWQGRRQAQQESQRQQATQRQQAEVVKDKGLVDGFMAGLQQKPDYASVWLPALRKANALVPRSVTGQSRLTLLNIIMQAHRFPSVLRDTTKQAYGKGREDAFGLRSMGAIPAGGERPDLETGELAEATQPGAQPNLTKDQQLAAEKFGARVGRIS